MTHAEPGPAFGVVDATDLAHAAMMSAMADDTLSVRALNRATLARQFLLERVSMPAIDVIERLVGLQAQEPPNPYVALWSRLVDFDPDELGQLLLDREVVRINVMRGTIHLVTAADCLELRPLTQPVIDGQLDASSRCARPSTGVDLKPVLAFARRLVAGANRERGRELRAAFAERFRTSTGRTRSSSSRHGSPLVQVPPRGLWRTSGIVRTTTAEAWLGRKLAARPSIDDVVLRYFAAFGPATVADVATWSRLTGLREVVERLRPRLQTFRDERGRELFDTPDAPRPDPDTPTPARFLPEYDNVLLSHADRTRFVSEAMRAVDFTVGGRILGSVLFDGALVGVWANAFDRKTGRATLTIRYGAKLTKKAQAALSAEGQRLLRFIHAEADDTDVVFTPVEAGRFSPAGADLDLHTLALAPCPQDEEVSLQRGVVPVPEPHEGAVMTAGGRHLLHATKAVGQPGAGQVFGARHRLAKQAADVVRGAAHRTTDVALGPCLQRGPHAVVVGHRVDVLPARVTVAPLGSHVAVQQRRVGEHRHVPLEREPSERNGSRRGPEPEVDEDIRFRLAQTREQRPGVLGEWRDAGDATDLQAEAGTSRFERLGVSAPDR